MRKMARRASISSDKIYRRQPMYDNRIITTAVAQTYDFFKTPFGQTEDSRTKTKFDTNMEVAGQTPSKQPFKVTGISLSLWCANGVQAVDFFNLITNAKAYFLFEIRRNIVLEIPLFEIPFNSGAYNSGTASDVDALTNGVPNHKNVFDLGKRPVIIEQQAPFNVSVQYLSAPTVAGTVSLYMFLHGTLSQPEGIK
jgi:hypothetical protein